MCGLLVLVGGCIGENPRWDEPVANGTTGATDDADASEGARGGDDADVDSTSSGAVVPDDSESSTSEGSESTTGAPTTDDGPICGPEQVMCDGECRNVETDKHYCGAECIDCTPRFGNNARCEDGVCAPHPGGGSGDDD